VINSGGVGDKRDGLRSRDRESR